MNAKNLPLKFAMVALLVIVCVWSLTTKGLKLGIDLRGGHSMIFKVETTENDPDDLLEQIIGVLKQRIDPSGLRSLEWRPIGNDRIEVRMPAAGETSREAQNAYREALRRLKSHNIQISQLRRVTQANGEARRREIATIVETVEGHEQLNADLAKLGRLHDQLNQAKQRFQAADDAVRANQDAGDLTALREAQIAARAAKLEAQEKYERFRDEVLEQNVNIGLLEGVLRNYISSREAKQLKETNEEELQRRRKEYTDRLKALRASYRDYPQRLEEINQVIEKYQAWAEVRQSLEDPADLKRMIAKAGVLEFRIAPPNPIAAQGGPITREQFADYLKELDDLGPAVTDKMIIRGERFVWFPIEGDVENFQGLARGRDRSGQEYVLLYNSGNNMLLQGDWKLSSAQPGTGQDGGPVVQFKFDALGGQQFGALTSAHVGDRLAFLLDNMAYSAPTLQSMITNSGQITGNFTYQETVEMSRLLNSGSLPGRVNPDPVSESSFGPTLGEENRRMGLRAAYIGLIAVAVFMLIYYLLAGSIADVALLLNLILILGVMSLINAVFTLPGIAGIILTIGIAVDANVLIFERLREEQERGQTIRMALKTAYERAFTAIFDANVTTMVTCLILGWVGTEEIKGFAITLGLGIVFSMFTALVITRWVFQLLLNWNVITKPIKMLRIIRTPKIDWMGKRKAFWAVSAVLLVAGVIGIIGQGSDLLGIEFSSGTQALVRLRTDALLVDPATGEKELPNDGLVRRQFKEAAELLEGELGGTVGQLTGARVERRIDPFRVQMFLDNYDTNQDDKVTAEEWAAHEMDPAYFAKAVARLDADKDGALGGDELADLPSREYQVSTTETLVSRVRTVIGKAFGTALDVRPTVSYDLLGPADTDAQAQAIRRKLGVSMQLTGDELDDGTEVYAATLDSGAVEAAAQRGLEEAVNFQGGMLAVIRNVSPALTRNDLLQRVRDIRGQLDHEALKTNNFNVIGLEEDPNNPEAYSVFVVLDSPADDSRIESAAAFRTYSKRVLASVNDALKKQESMPVINFDKAIAAEAARKAIMAIILSWLAIVLYLWLRFGSLQWGIAAVICLVHDVVIVLGLVAISGYLYNTFGEVLGIQAFKVDLAMIAALLTVIGYSVNDTIVVFDRIRENRGKLTTITPQVLNSSVNQTLARTLLTSTTTLIVVLVMYLFGGAGIRAFSFALLMGVLFGTYSSIAIASPLLMGFKRAVTAKVVKEDVETTSA